MNDYLVKYNNQAQLNTDNLPGKHGIVDPQDGFRWRADHSMEVKAWRPSQDTTDQDGNIVHNYLPGIWVLISTIGEDGEIEQNNNMQIGTSRSKCNARATRCLKLRNPNAPPKNDIRFEPIYMGMDVPWGDLR